MLAFVQGSMHVGLQLCARVDGARVSTVMRFLSRVFTHDHMSMHVQKSACVLDVLCSAVFAWTYVW